MQKRITSLQSRAKNAVAHAEGVVQTAVTTLETGAAAFGLGVVQGRWGPIDLLGVPVDLAAAVALHAMALLGMGGEASHHMQNFGNGALASYLNTVGRGIGISMAQEPAETAGGVDSLTDDDLKNL
jgi:hypothetical protein